LAGNQRSQSSLKNNNYWSAIVPDIDTEKFRLRRFVEKLNTLGDVEIREEPIDLIDVASEIEKNKKIILFKEVGPEKIELVANVNGSRRRLAVALNVDEVDVIKEFQRRLDSPQPIVDVQHADAPVQKIVLKGEEADLSKLPFYLQHQLDGSPYISSGIDYCTDPETGTTNVGCRRLSLRNKNSAGTNLTAPSDLKRIYQGCVARGEILPISFAIGSHPIDYMAAGMRIPADEISLVSTLRGEPLPLVKCLTNNIRVPADSEMILEGYLDERGYIEPDGPYGEYVGFYGPMHMDPVFHLTAITMRKDVLHQTLLHGSGPEIHRSESVHLLAIRYEAQIFKILQLLGVSVKDVYVPPGSAEGQHVRVSIKQTRPGQARNVIAAIFASVFGAKHIFVTDEDINIKDENAFEWALVSRFQADRDLVIFDGMMGMPMDPSLDEKSIIGAKAGFDLTLPLQSRDKLTMQVAKSPKIEGPARYQTVLNALENESPLFFSDLVTALGSRDSREIAIQLDKLRNAGKLLRNSDGQYLLGETEKGRTGLFGPQHDYPNSNI
jgi:UbiD family decarboxylase